MPGDQIWPIVLLGISLLGNLILLFQKPIRRLLRREEKVSEDNIMAMVEEGEESGAIQSNEKTLIENVFDFDTMTARDVMVRYKVHACTDVTGFGLMGHGFEMAQGSDVALHIDVSAIDLIPEALEFARMGVLPAGMYRNRSFAEAGVDVGTTELAVQDLLFDPQTSGGLLMAVDPADADALLAELTPVVPSAQRIGTVGEYHGGKRILLR